MSKNEIMASEQKAVEYLMFFIGVGILPPEGWDHQTIDDHIRKGEGVRRFVFEKSIVQLTGDQTVRFKEPIWRMIVDLKKENSAWRADWIDVAKTTGYISHSYGREEIPTIERLMVTRREFSRIPITVGQPVTQ